MVYCHLDVCSELDCECEFVQMYRNPNPLGCPCWPLTQHAPLRSSARSGETELSSFIRRRTRKFSGGFGQYKVGSCRGSVWLSSFALDCQRCLEFGVHVWSEEIMLTLSVESPPWIFGLISMFSGGRELFHWHSVVVEFTVNRQLRCSTEMGMSMSAIFPCK